eukprot:Blabericola_migrator_1__2496@NODE_1701_length_3974_cov_5_901715_g1101_i0_p2_GENE_NODE_1701_length_3974_cov_5_901715_g1101_i0NODE_1701_length_3974_cov_5_901715_g1101_i0_p2_ORF_typecomplete_len138_score17_06_NODE_1701_length_3974_cov_5_901715_g1101_i0240653
MHLVANAYHPTRMIVLRVKAKLIWEDFKELCRLINLAGRIYVRKIFVALENQRVAILKTVGRDSPLTECLGTYESEESIHSLYSEDLGPEDLGPYEHWARKKARILCGDAVRIPDKPHYPVRRNVVEPPRKFLSAPR